VPPRTGEGGAGEARDGRRGKMPPRTSSAIDSIEVCR
jgi:hypothetical protein